MMYRKDRRIKGQAAMSLVQFRRTLDDLVRKDRRGFISLMEQSGWKVTKNGSEVKIG